MKPTKPKKCKWCKELFTPRFSTTEAACSPNCAIELVKLKNKQTVDKEQLKSKRQDRQRLKELMTRTAWFAKLQIVVNQWVMYRDKDKPCCTCGTTRPIKYDAGHFHTKKARPDIRFELTNIHRQCSQQCNVYGSGKRNEYEKFIAVKYGENHVDWLAEIKPTLKEQFPNWQDIETEIKKYRVMLREVDIKPHI